MSCLDYSLYLFILLSLGDPWKFDHGAKQESIEIGGADVCEASWDDADGGKDKEF